MHRDQPCDFSVPICLQGLDTYRIVAPHRFWLYQLSRGGSTGHAMILGGIAGAVGASLIALGGLYKHRIRLDLDGRFTLWYLLKPLVGAVMGGFVGLLAGIVVVGAGASTSSPVVILLSAFGGMHEAWAMNLFEGYMAKVLGSGNPAASGSMIKT
jgi:hypothetical protein